MSIKVVVKKTIRVNGKEYQSVEELSPELRSAYERALSGETCSSIENPTESRAGTLPTGQGSAEPKLSAHASAQFRISYGGREYTSVEELPFAVRKLYEAVTAVVGGRVASSSGTVPGTAEGAGAGTSDRSSTVANEGAGAISGDAVCEACSVGSASRTVHAGTGDACGTSEASQEIDPMLLPTAPEGAKGFPSDRGLLPRPVMWLVLGLAGLLALWAIGSLIARH